MITYLKGDATCPNGDGSKIIVHICNNYGGWGRGFVLAISKKWRQPELVYRKWHQDQEYDGVTFELGGVVFIEVENDITVANMIAQTSVVNYDSVRIGLRKTAKAAKESNSSLHMPRIGCGLGGGTWDRIEPMIRKECKGIEVFVYDLS